MTGYSTVNPYPNQKEKHRDLYRGERIIKSQDIDSQIGENLECVTLSSVSLEACILLHSQILSLSLCLILIIGSLYLCRDLFSFQFCHNTDWKSLGLLELSLLFPFIPREQMKDRVSQGNGLMRFQERA